MSALKPHYSGKFPLNPVEKPFSLKNLPLTIKCTIDQSIIDSTVAQWRNKPRSISSMHWDHRDWVHHRGVGWGCHGWVGIVRWHGWVEIASVVIWMSSLLFSCILCFCGPSPKRLKARWANFRFKPKCTGARFSKGPETFWARRPILKSESVE